MSYRYSQTNPAPVSHRLKCYHKLQYQDDETATLQETPVNKRVGHFVTKGVEKSKDHQSLVYGSGVSYATGKRIDHRNSSEKLKLKRQQIIDAEADISRHRDRKEMENIERILEKQKDLKMLQQYHPWGKPGAGVPRQSPSGTLCVRKAGLALDSAPQSREDQQREAYFPFGRPGAGAPRRTKSGNVITSKPTNLDTNYQQRCKNPEPIIYTPPQPPPVTPEIESKIREMERKQRYARRLEEQRREAEERRREDRSQKDSVYDPWEKDLPVRNDSGMIVARQRVVNETGFVGEAEGAGELLGQLDKWKEERNAKRMKREPSDKGYDPWGRPGGGAPLLTQSGHLITNKANLKKQESLATNEYEYERRGHGLSLAMCMRKGKQTAQHKDKPYHASVTENEVEGGMHSYRTELQRQAEFRHRQQRAEKEENINEDKQHVMRMGQLWPRSNHYLKNLQKKEYYSELQKMTEEKQETQRTEQRSELESERQHLQTVDKLWGRPGCGAPRVTAGGLVDASPHYSNLMSTATYTAHYQFRRV